MSESKSQQGPPPDLDVTIQRPVVDPSVTQVLNEEVLVEVSATGADVIGVWAECYAAGTPRPTDPESTGTALSKVTGQSIWSGCIECSFCSEGSPWTQFDIIALVKFEDPGGGDPIPFPQIDGPYNGQCVEDDCVDPNDH